MIQSKQMWVEKIDTLSKELKLPKNHPSGF
jgi:hypothetical protein